MYAVGARPRQAGIYTCRQFVSGCVDDKRKTKNKKIVRTYTNQVIKRTGYDEPGYRTYWVRNA